MVPLVVVRASARTAAVTIAGVTAGATAGVTAGTTAGTDAGTTAGTGWCRLSWLGLVLVCVRTLVPTSTHPVTVKFCGQVCLAKPHAACLVLLRLSYRRPSEKEKERKDHCGAV